MIHQTYYFQILFDNLNRILLKLHFFFKKIFHEVCFEEFEVFFYKNMRFLQKPHFLKNSFILTPHFRGAQLRNAQRKIFSTKKKISKKIFEVQSPAVSPPEPDEHQDEKYWILKKLLLMFWQMIVWQSFDLNFHHFIKI